MGVWSKVLLCVEGGQGSSHPKERTSGCVGVWEPVQREPVQIGGTVESQWGWRGVSKDQSRDGSLRL